MKKKSYVTKPENQAVLKQLREKMEQKCPEKSREFNIYEHLPSQVPADSGLDVPDFISNLMDHKADTLQRVIPLIRQSVKRGTSISALGGVESKTKTPQEASSSRKQFEFKKGPSAHPRIPPEGTELNLETPEATLPEDKQYVTKESSAIKPEKYKTFEQNRSAHKRTMFEPVKKRIAKQKNTQKPTDKVSKDHIREQAEIIMSQKLDSEQSGMVVTQDPLVKSENHSFEKSLVHEVLKDASKIVNQGSTSSEEGSKKTFTVLTVHVHGDSPPSAISPKYISALKVAKNGRYKDEADLFCENNYQEIPGCVPQEKTKKNSFKENFLESSNSETVTSKLFSIGEVNCHCSVSSGELHICKESIDKKQKELKKKSIYRKRTYFNNWITYYVKNEHVNDSSWSSSNK